MDVTATEAPHKTPVDPQPNPRASQRAFLIDSSTIRKRRKSRRCIRSKFLIDSDLTTRRSRHNIHRRRQVLLSNRNSDELKFTATL